MAELVPADASVNCVSDHGLASSLQSHPVIISSRLQTILGESPDVARGTVNPGSV